MSFPDALRRDPAAYPVHRDLTTRVGDMDGYGHLNAVRIGTYYEDARAAFYKEMGEVARARVLVAQITTRYLGEGFWPGDVTVGTGIGRIGTSSFTMLQGLWQNGVCIGLADKVMVHVDAGGSAPIPDDYRGALQRLAMRFPAGLTPAG